MKEKSCGIVVYKIENNEIKYLLLNQLNSTWSFPKGHVEAGETEVETALRETKEECNLDINVDTNFRETVEYVVPSGNLKEVVYFVGTPIEENIKLQKAEISKYEWDNYLAAYNTLQFENSKSILKKANNYLTTDNLK